MSTSASNAEHEAERISVNISPRPARTSTDGPVASQNIFFEDHWCETYVWPFELCRTYEATKSLIEEVYMSHYDDRHVNEVKKGRYDIETGDGAIILPSVWNFIVKPSSTIKISFRRNDASRRESSPVSVGGRWRRSIPDHQSDTVRAPESRRRPREYVEEVTIDIGNHRSSASAPYTGSDSEDRVTIDGETEDDSDSDSLLSSSDRDDELPKDVESRKITREVPPLIDLDGNKLSFAIDTSKATQHPVAQGQIEKNRDDTKRPQQKERAVEGSAEKYRITKATTSGTDTRTIIQIHILPGPINDKLHDSVQMTWYHVHSPQLNLSRLKETCLELPNLSDRLRLLTGEALAQVERHKVKAFLDGFFIEPGTVLRTIEKCQSDPKAVIFSCIPYLELQQPLQRLSSKPVERLFPPRTLMQAMYPYEPVQDRDSEQAYKKLGNDQSDSLVYMPNLWMMNIGTEIVVTYGHQPLADEMLKSIEVVQEDLSQLGATDITKNSLTTIKLGDRDGLVHLYSLESCRSYFQMEARLIGLETAARGVRDSESYGMIWNSPVGKMTVTANTWNAIIQRTDLISIDLEVAKEALATPAIGELNLDILITDGCSVPPFFHWSSAVGDKAVADKLEPQDVIPFEVRHEKQCLDYAEKSMLNETIGRYSTINAVDKTFASTIYYQSLPEDTHEHVGAQFQLLCSETGHTSHPSYHADIVATQCASIVAKSDSFCKIVQATFSLFVSDTSNSSILRKVWSAMGNVHKWAVKVQKRGAVELDAIEPSGSENRRCRTGHTGWYIRGGKEGLSPIPAADKKVKRSVRHCRRCTSVSPFEGFEAAVNHLRSHVDPPSSHAELLSERQVSGPPNSGNELKIDDWIVHTEQLKREELNTGGLKVLTQACEDALDLLGRIKELADGVRNEDGKKSDLYKFPQQLLEAFRKLIVFYLAIERALYHTEESYQHVDDARKNVSDLPYSEEGMRVLKKFSQGVENSVLLARYELCSMVRPETPTDSMQDLSLGPEYVCGWLMRRLLVKPLEKRMSVGDMYREYLSTIQFQVNHRPGKRLIRGLNLLQEELQVLAMINSWQTNVVQNYMRVLNDKTYETDVPYRRAMFPYERMLLQSCLENLALAREEYNDLIRRCGPLSDQTKQSLEIYEEDHGKAITAFTVVTVIFLPLSFVTSYFGMNTVDIRDMGSGQSLFWAIALPLTFVTIGATVLIGYNGGLLRDFIASVYHRIIGKQDSSMSARGISVAQRKRAKQFQNDANDALETSIADEAEYAKPQPETNLDEWYNNRYIPYTYAEAIEPASRIAKMDPYVPVPRAEFRTQRLKSSIIPALPVYEEPVMRYGGRHMSRPVDYRVDEENYTSRARPMPEVTAYDAVIRQDGNNVWQDEYTWHKKRRHLRAGGEWRERR